MIQTERFIWLPKDKYPNNQATCYSCGHDYKEYNYTVAEFSKKFEYAKKIKHVILRYTADTQLLLYLNGELIDIGPDVVGGDFLGNHKMRDLWFAAVVEKKLDVHSLDFFARVKMYPVELCEFSKGKGGFMLSCLITFEDGTKKLITTDNTWLCRKNGAFIGPKLYNEAIAPDEFTYAAEQDNIWFPKTSPLPRRTTEQFNFENGTIHIKPNENKSEILVLPKIYGGFVKLRCKAKGKIQITVRCSETGEHGTMEDVTFCKDSEYQSFELHSAGFLEVCVHNQSDFSAQVDVSFIAIYYPVTQNAVTVTSDRDLNKVLEVCAHTLKICRQTHHLDSPRHSEPLACTGDYYIETLMTAFSYGDMRLAKLDLLRTAEMFIKNDGRIFHTSYSLIWIMMLHDVYMLTGDKKLLSDCEEALLILLQRFEGYVTELGIIDNPPNYMFVDWIFIDGFSLHHPPKALGQSVLNMFYYGGLDYAAKIFAFLGDTAMSESLNEKKQNLGKNIKRLLYDDEKGLFFEGLGHKIPESMVIDSEQPQNVDKRYYLPHSNILACAFGVANRDEARNILEKVMYDEFPCQYQPYFAHFMLEAIYRNGLRDKFTLQVIEKWKEPVKQCDKGLVEGFIPPDESYVFDHSHAWGGTPLYSLPKALTGFEITEPGMKAVKLSPCLLGVESARVEIPSPYGFITVEMNKNSDAVISAPPQIKIITE